MPTTANSAAKRMYWNYFWVFLSDEKMTKWLLVGLPDSVHVRLRTELALQLTSQSIILYDLICPFTKTLASFPSVIWPLPHRRVFFLNKQLLSVIYADHVLFPVPYPIEHNPLLISLKILICKHISFSSPSHLVLWGQIAFPKLMNKY